MARIGKTKLESYFNWREMFEEFRRHPDDPHVANVFRILELLKVGRPWDQIELNKRLNAYRWQSRVVISKSQGAFEVLGPELAARDWEHKAVRWLLNLLRERGELDLVHKCSMHGRREGCLGWYYGRKYGKEENRFCSKACKSYKRDNDPETIKARKARNAARRKGRVTARKALDKGQKNRIGFGRPVRHRAKRPL
jgi:hypothetical protein